MFLSGLAPINVPIGTWSVNKDEVGFQLATVMLRAASQETRGRNSHYYVQYDAIRKLRSAFSSTVHENLASAAMGADVLKGDMGQTFGVTHSNSDSYFFRKFC